MKSLATTVGTNHSVAHCATVDEQGNGQTSFDGGHSHYVRGFAVVPAAHHTHGLTGSPCGHQVHARQQGCAPCKKRQR